MSLDNVIAIAAAAQTAAALVDLAHATAVKTILITFGLATSVPLIVVGSAILMALLERFRVLVWGGGALLGWIAGDVMVKDVALSDWLSQPIHDLLHIWGGPLGGIIVLGAGYVLVGKHRRLILDEILAGLALLIWIVVDRVNDSLFGGPDPDLLRIWSVRGGLLVVLIVVYAIARSLWHVEKVEVAADKKEAAE
jgi:predicted tellurium resistance membrane protein TerC